jgi:ATP-dependent helicase/nuclease subunit B
MSSQPAAQRLFTIAPGVPFLPALADAVLAGTLVPGAPPSSDPLALADTTIYLPTRRAARTLRSLLAERLGGAAILPTVRPLGEFDEDADLFEAGLDSAAAALDLAPPLGGMERLLVLAPLVQAWKARLPTAIRARFGEEVVVPASPADAIWLSRDLAALIDEAEMEGADWKRLAGLVPDDLAGWWQVTLDFLEIATRYYPEALAARGRSSPGAHLSASIDAETARLTRRPPPGPVIAAGSTGSVPATARLLAAVARLPNGAVVLPGLDTGLDEASWMELCEAEPHPSVCGHPQFGLRRLLAALGAVRSDVTELAAPSPALAARRSLVSQALRPAETTEAWAHGRGEVDGLLATAGLTLVEAANEREEAEAAALALRLAIGEPGRTAALVTTDRALARRVSAELARHGIRADDSGGRPLAKTPPTRLLTALAAAAAAPGDPVPVLAVIKHPLVQCGLPRHAARRAAEIVELVALRGGTGRPDLLTLAADFDRRIAMLADDRHAPAWFARLGEADTGAATTFLAGMQAAVAPLAALARAQDAQLSAIARAAVEALEATARDETGGFGRLYDGDAGQALAGFLRELTGARTDLTFAARDWPAVLDALLAGSAVKPPAGSDPRVSIWGVLEARLQHVDTMVLAGMNEGSWPRRAEADRFMSRFMKLGLDMQPPERRIGQAAHDFEMAMGSPQVVLTRAARAGDAPAVASRLLQRLEAFAGPQRAAEMKARGQRLVRHARALAAAAPQPPVARPRPTPPLAARPKRFSVTEVERLRRDPYAIHAGRILELQPLEPLLRDPGAIERGSLFHDVLHRFALAGIDPRAEDAVERLTGIGREVFAEAALPADVEAVWWPRFRKLAAGIVGWERTKRPEHIRARLAEVRADAVEIGATGARLSGRADRIDLLNAGYADILDYKTGSYPSRVQAHRLLAPQLALEAALMMRGAFAAAGRALPDQLAYVRLKPDGEVDEDSILSIRGANASTRSAPELADDAWERLERMVAFYGDEANGYISRALPFRAGIEGDYDHLARVAEWSAGNLDGDEGTGE